MSVQPPSSGQVPASDDRKQIQQPRAIGSGIVPSHDAYAEPHFRIDELAKMWNIGRETVRRLIMDDPGVIKIRMGPKKVSTTYSVQESAARRIHTRLLNGE